MASFHPTVTFLAYLLNCAPQDVDARPVTFQTFDDEKPGGKARGELARTLHGPLRELLPTLEDLNQRGAGVFVTVNGTDGKGRKKTNIRELRAWWCDLDAKGARSVLDLERLPLAPSMTVKTPGGWHLYWIAEAPMPALEDPRRAEHEAEVKAIAAALVNFGGDLKACDVARVLRLPGFQHRKNSPRSVELVQAEGPRYTRPQVQAAFPALKKEQAMEARSAGMVRPAPSNRDGVLKRAARYLDTMPSGISGQGGHMATFAAALKLATGFDLSEAETLDLMRDQFNPRCDPPWTPEELAHKVQGAWSSAQQSPQRGHLLEESHNRRPRIDTPRRALEGPQPAEDAPAEEAEPGALPEVPGFRMGPSGLFLVRMKPGQNGDQDSTEEQRIAPPFRLPGLVRDEQSQGWRLLIAWEDLDGATHEEAVPFDLLSGEGAELARLLGQGGMVIHPDLNRRKALLRFIALAVPRIRRRVRLVDALGWTDGAFVLPSGETIGQALEPVRYAGEADRLGAGTRGTLEGWKEGVARLAVGNPRLAFALACAFSGPLLELVRPDGGGGFNLMGSSSRGKSTCLEAAASVWGRPHPLPTWRATSNGMEGIAAARNDGFLALDELSQVDPKEAGQVAYLLANGSAKARASRDGGARAMRQWRLVFLSSGEQGLEDKLSEDGKRVRAGQEVRVPDIPCPPEGMFSEAHGLPSLGALAEHLKAQSRKHYGHAARAFLRGLCEEWPRRETLQAKLREMEARWLAEAVPHGADGQVSRVAGRFALVGLAGELAQRMGILPWPEGEAEAAALVCFRAWLERRGHIGASERARGLQAVVDFLAQHGLSRFAPWNDPEARPLNMAGVRKASQECGPEGSHAGWDFFITPTGWKEACKGFDPRTVARDALEEGLLEEGQGNRAYQKRKTPHGEGRFYIIRGSALGAFRVLDVA